MFRHARNDTAFHLDDGLGGLMAVSWDEPVCIVPVSFHLVGGLGGRTASVKYSAHTKLFLDGSVSRQ